MNSTDSHDKPECLLQDDLWCHQQIEEQDDREGENEVRKEAQESVSKRPPIIRQQVAPA